MSFQPIRFLRIQHERAWIRLSLTDRRVFLVFSVVIKSINIAKKTLLRWNRTHSVYKVEVFYMRQLTKETLWNLPSYRAVQEATVLGDFVKRQYKEGTRFWSWIRLNSRSTWNEALPIFTSDKSNSRNTTPCFQESGPRSPSLEQLWLDSLSRWMCFVPTLQGAIQVHATSCVACKSSVSTVLESHKRHLSATRKMYCQQLQMSVVHPSLLNCWKEPKVSAYCLPKP